MNILMRIKRFDPEKDGKPYWDEFRVEADPIDRLLDALNTVKWTMDGCSWMHPREFACCKCFQPRTLLVFRPGVSLNPGRHLTNGCAEMIHETESADMRLHPCL